MKTTTNKHILKKVGKCYIASILGAMDEAGFVDIPDDDYTYIVNYVQKYGERLDERFSSLEQCYNKYVDDYELKDE